MARYAPAQATGTYDIVQQWITNCLEQNGSLLSVANATLTVNPQPVPELWTSDNLETTKDLITGQPHFETLLTAAEKLDANDASRRLLGELLFLLYLALDEGVVGAARKRAQLSRILGQFHECVWPGNAAQNALLPCGTGSFGGNNRYVPMMGMLCVFCRTFKQDGGDRTAKLVNAFTAAAPNFHPQAEVFYNSLLHLVDPESFERIASTVVKNELAGRGQPFLGEHLNPPEIPSWATDSDRSIRCLRNYLEVHYPQNFGRGFDWYMQQGNDWVIRPLPDPAQHQTLADVNHQVIAGGNVMVAGRLAVRHNLILYGPPGTGKTYELDQIRNRHSGSSHFVTFHQSFSYEDFVEGIRPEAPANGQGGVTYRVKNGIFKRFCAEAKNQPQSQYILFIDEINRGNVAAIFGELITLIEEDKRGQNWAVTLPYSGETFWVPENVWIIGTMNTADRSVEALDTALRRRFAFIEMPPQPDLLANDVAGVNLRALLTTINKRLEILKDRDHRIGHSYLLNCHTLEDVRNAFRHAILPLLQEYFYNDYGKIGAVLGTHVLDAHEADQDDFPNETWQTLDDYHDKRVYIIRDVNEWTLADFVEMYDHNAAQALRQAPLVAAAPAQG